MLDCINPMPLYRYLRNPSTENALVASECFQKAQDYLTTISKSGKIATIILGTVWVVASLLNSRATILQEERRQTSRHPSAAPAVSVMNLVAKFFLCVTFLSASTWATSYTSAWLTGKAAALIKSN